MYKTLRNFQVKICEKGDKNFCRTICNLSPSESVLMIVYSLKVKIAVTQPGQAGTKKDKMPALAPAPSLRLGRRGAKGASAAGQGSNLLPNT
jgi:hypothetical protein